MFLNISNHPSSKWTTEQLNAARLLAGGHLVCAVCGQSCPNGFCPYCNGNLPGPSPTKVVGGEVRDIQFPNVPPTASYREVQLMANALVADLPWEGARGGCYHRATPGEGPTAQRMAVQDEGSEAFEGPNVAMVQGEFSLTYELSRMMMALGWSVVVATTERLVEEVDGKKVVTFKFVRFRALRK